MANKMLIDASHPEETRVVVVRGNRIEEFDFESEHKKQLKGNIYLAKVTRVEPSLQAAFVEYGGNRHGFLAFSEIHPDYYQIPVADRQALIEEELARVSEDDDADEPKPEAKSGAKRPRRSRKAAQAADVEGEDSVSEPVASDTPEAAAAEEAEPAKKAPARRRRTTRKKAEPEAEAADTAEAVASPDDERPAAADSAEPEADDSPVDDGHDEPPMPEQIGSEDAMEEVPERHRAPRKQYKIQEVIKRRQILLVQVVKEERGNKGAALTTYLSLAGRYSVLMPNTARGGGISRKITNVTDRKRLKEVVRDLEVPRGMGIILRTAGANRTKAEVKRDYEYLMRLWENVRTLTLASTAPALVYEEGSLIKRSIRDLYNKDIDQILVAGDAGYREAKDFMRMLMPSQAKVVQRYQDPTPIFARQGIEAQLDKMLQPNVTLRSGGYIIINQTEALVAIDVNSGRSTREHSVEDTALQTNLEAAEEVARQLRLRDLAGLIVIDFIDMEEKRNNRAVEKRLKDCLKNDRARIQIGSISHFGLMEMSRQRIRASVLESTMQVCPTCGGNGFIRSASSLALHVLRSIEEHILKHGTHNVIVKVPTATALYILNEKRSTLDELERNHGLHISIQAEEGHGHAHVAIENGAEVPRKIDIEVVQPQSVVPVDDDIVDEETPEAPEPAAEARDGSEEPRRRKRRRRRRRGEGDSAEGNARADDSGEEDAADESEEDDVAAEASAEVPSDDENGGDRKRRRRGRRGGRRGRDAAADDADSDGQSEERIEDAATLAEEVESGVIVAENADEPFARASDDDAAPDAVDEDTVVAAEEAAIEDVNGAVPAQDVAAAPEDAIETEEEAAAPAPSEPAAPVVTKNGEAAEAEEKPKRTGWWARRSFF
ncbi:ribonuclease E/G [Aureimonas altamirensis]|uniref:Rne/Rng family ribonuclease n=1 Tax=Aureimonas altamirensis TaxID=370622 RepID=UPI002036C5BC|nr:ribonuclease E/G [Aureimonas altamirensis]MCM2502956.1 ribonuclease E/G [Aureimonas altamirensis]